MSSLVHEALVELFRVRPQMVWELLTSSGLLPADPSAPAPSVRVCETDLGTMTPTERRADLVVRFGDTTGLAVIIEVQLHQDADKPWTWPAYLCNLRSAHRCGVLLLVVTLDEGVARWASRPIPLGPGNALTPTVLGPSQVPMITDPDVARAAPEAALLSAMAHARGPYALAIGEAAWLAAAELDEERTRVYVDLILRSLDEVARHLLEAKMIPNWEPQSDYVRKMDAQGFRRGLEQGLEKGLEQGLEKGLEQGLEKGLEQGLEKGLERGRLDGERQVFLRLLRRRFGDPSAELLARILSANEAALLSWSDAVLFAPTVDDVFAESRP